MSNTAFAADETLFSARDFSAALAESNSPITVFKQALTSAQETMDQRFKDGEDIRKLVYGRAWLVDQLLLQAWHLFKWPPEQHLSLIAVDGIQLSWLR